MSRQERHHALTHKYHGANAVPSAWRRFIPAFGTAALASVIAACMLGALLVAVAEDV